jgi:DNA-binding beta-propeller fold protein YncE
MKAVALFFLSLASMATAPAESLKLAQTIQLPGVEGRIDHLSIDVAGSRLFIAALGNNSVEVVDLKAGKVVRSLTGLSEPQGVLYIPAVNRLYVANGGDGALRVFDGATFAPLAAIPLGKDADNVRYDEENKEIYVGYGSGALARVNIETNTLLSRISLSAHPESFQLEANGSRIFVNVPGSHKVTVVDRSTGKELAHWSLGLAAANFPLALDESNHRAFVGCRLPSRLLVFDTMSGKEVAKLELNGDCDDIFYDSVRRQIYASCGEGFINVFSQSDADHYSLKSVTKTAPKARTCLFRDSQIFLAIPKSAGRPAEIHCYDLPK